MSRVPVRIRGNLVSEGGDRTSGKERTYLLLSGDEENNACAEGGSPWTQKGKGKG